MPTSADREHPVRYHGNMDAWQAGISGRSVPCLPRDLHNATPLCQKRHFRRVGTFPAHAPLWQADTLPSRRRRLLQFVLQDVLILNPEAVVCCGKATIGGA